MDNTYTLIGLSVITICCIYLFYLNFKMSKEHEAIKNQISNVKFIVDTHTNALHIVEKHLQNNFNTRNIVPPPPPPALSPQQNQDSSISPQHKQEVSLPVEIKNNDENENETDSINLDENEIAEINKLDNEMEDELENELENEIEIEHEEEEVIEEFLIDEPFQAPPSSNNTPLKFEDLNNLDDIEDLEVEVEDLNQHSIPIMPTTTKIETETEAEAEAETSKLENEFDGLSFTNLKIITKEELNNSSLKQLKIIAKNCGVVSRGSKETLIAAIYKKIQSS